MIEYKEGKMKLFNVETSEEIEYKVKTLDEKQTEISKEGFNHYMIKEIVEQKHTIKEASVYSEEELKPLVDQIKKSNTVYTVGAGTAYFAASQTAFFLRKIAGIKAVELKAYEIDSYKNLFTKEDLVIAFSQSGETADTIEALEIAKSKGAKIASLVNMVGSTTSRMSDFSYFCRSGPEICVASTKAFTAKQSWGLLLAGSIIGEHSQMQNKIHSSANKLESYFTEELFSQIKKLSKKLIKNEHFFVLGRGQNFNIALEAALKVKEITYKHFEGFAAGELKHGVIALVDKGTPVFIISSDDEDLENMLSASAQVKARGAWVIGVGQSNNDLFDDFIPTIQSEGIDALTNVIPFQLISYFMALELGNDPDKPRNLAKSVTVK
jgi:glucosamine--fructose-6-phosphate aminotransferase (isomerizing)